MRTRLQPRWIWHANGLTANTARFLLAMGVLMVLLWAPQPAIAAPPTPSTWVDRSAVEISGTSGLNVDVVTDDEDRPHLAYTVSDSSGWVVKYKYWSPTSGAWTESVVTSGLSSEPKVALVLLPSGSSATPVILFTRLVGTVGSLWAATESGSSWSLHSVDSFSGEAKGMDATPGKLTSSSATQIGIAYHRGNSDQLWFAFGSGSSFSQTYVDKYVLSDISVCFDQTGAFHIASVGQTSFTVPAVHYARHPSGGAWTTGLYAANPPIAPDGVSVAATTGGYPRISYIDKSPQYGVDILHRNNHNSTFSRERIHDIEADIENSTAVQIGSDGTVFVASEGGRVSDVLPRAWISASSSLGTGAWETTEMARPCATRGPSPDLGAPESGLALAIDSQDNLHLAYTLHNLDDDAGHHGVAYLGWKQPWATDSDQSGSGGYFTTSLALDAQEYPWVCTFDQSGSTFNLTLRQYTGSSWVQHVVATGLSTGDPYAHACSVATYGSLTIAAAYSTGTGTLKYVLSTDGGGSWTTETVDSSGAGVHTSLVLSSSTTAHIGYDRSGSLYYALRLGTNSWSTQAVASSQAASFLSIGLQSNGRPAISFYGLNRLRYGSRLSNGSWTVEDVSGTGMGWDNSLTFTGATPTISFYNQSGSSLWLAEKPSSSWILTEIDDGVDGTLSDSVGEMTSVAHDALGRWKISYYNRSGESLKIAYQEPLVSGGVLLCEEDDGGLGSSHKTDTHGNPRVSHKMKSNLHLRYHGQP